MAAGSEILSAGRIAFAQFLRPIRAWPASGTGVNKEMSVGPGLNSKSAVQQPGSKILERLKPSALGITEMTDFARALSMLKYTASGTEEVIPLFG